MRLVGCGRFVAEGRGVVPVPWSGRCRPRRSERGFGESVFGASLFFGFVTVAPFVAAFALALTPLISLLYTVISRGAARFDAEFFTWSMRGVIGEGAATTHAIARRGLLFPSPRHAPGPAGGRRRN